jgi:hypothetical protein
MIQAKENLTGDLGNTLLHVYPELEELKVTPSLNKQNFTPEKYGYSSVTVEAIETENLNITPSLEQQAFDGIYKEVTVNPIEDNKVTITPKTESQSFNGVYTGITVNPIEENNLVIDPKSEQQTFSGVYTDVTVNEIQGDTLNITPSAEEQTYNGVYTNVIVGSTKGEDLTITPSTQEQNFKGLYGNVNVNPITGDTLNITPTTSEQIHEGIYTTVNVGAITGEEITITPSAIQQIKSGLFNKVTVTGDSNLIAENIKEGVNIFGVNGVLTTEVVTKPYIELEYIESTGTQHIETDYQPNNSTAYEFEISKVSSPYDAPIFSASSVWSFESCIFTALNQKYNWWYYNGDSIKIGDVSTGDRVDKIYIYRGYTKLNDVVVTSNTSVTSNYRADRPLIIFSGPITGPDGHYTKFRLHSFKIMYGGPNENPSYIRDFIPVKMKDTGEVGLYDKVEEKFYPNKGTGTFVAGPEQLAGNATIKNLTNSATFKVSTWLTTISKLNLTGITSMEGAFTNYANLLEIPEEMDTSSVTTMASAFSFCSSLPEIKNLNTENVVNMTGTFNNCTKLTKLPQLRADEVRTIYNTFNECNSLSDFGGLLNIGKSFYNTTTNAYYHTLTFTGANNLTHDSLMNIINGLYDLNITYSSVGQPLYSQSLKLGATNIAKLSSEEIAIATNKGWNVS